MTEAFEDEYFAVSRQPEEAKTSVHIRCELTAPLLATVASAKMDPKLTIAPRCAGAPVLHGTLCVSWGGRRCDSLSDW